MKLYKKRITEYFSLPYDLTFEHENSATGLLAPHSCPAIIYYINNKYSFRQFA